MGGLRSHTLQEVAIGSSAEWSLSGVAHEGNLWEAIWWKKSCTHQLRLVVYLIIYRVFYTSQVVVWDFFHQLYVDDWNLIFAWFVPCIEGFHRPWSLFVTARTEGGRRRKVLVYIIYTIFGGMFQCSTMLSHVSDVKSPLEHHLENRCFFTFTSWNNVGVSAPLHLDDQQHTSCTTCECLWSQSDDLWIQARTISQDHSWSHFMLLQYHNRWRPKKVYSITYTVYTATPQHVTLPSQPFWFYTSLPVGGKKCSEGSGEILHLRGGELCFWRWRVGSSKGFKKQRKRCEKSDAWDERHIYMYTDVSICNCRYFHYA